MFIFFRLSKTIREHNTLISNNFDFLLHPRSIKRITTQHVLLSHLYFPLARAIYTYTEWRFLNTMLKIFMTWCWNGRNSVSYIYWSSHPGLHRIVRSPLPQRGITPYKPLMPETPPIIFTTISLRTQPNRSFYSNASSQPR